MSAGWMRAASNKGITGRSFPSVHKKWTRHPHGTLSWAPWGFWAEGCQEVVGAEPTRARWAGKDGRAATEPGQPRRPRRRSTTRPHV